MNSYKINNKRYSSRQIIEVYDWLCKEGFTPDIDLLSEVYNGMFTYFPLPTSTFVRTLRDVYHDARQYKETKAARDLLTGQNKVLTEENEKLKAELELLKMKPKMSKSEFQSDAYEQYCKEYDEHKAELEAKVGKCNITAYFPPH